MSVVDSPSVDTSYDAAVSPARSHKGRVRTDRVFRVALAGTLLIFGVALFVQAAWWRAAEAGVGAHLMAVWTGRRAVSISGVPAVVLYDGSAPQMAFLVTSECSVGYLVGMLAALSAPLMMVRRLPVGRVLAALAISSLCLFTTNVGRLAGIGASVSRWGDVEGLVVGHTYLGSVATFAGTTVAGVLFVAVLMFAREPTPATNIARQRG